MIYTEQYINELREAQVAIPKLDQLKNCTVLITGGGGLICSMIADFLLVMNDTRQTNVQVYVMDKNLEQTCNRFGTWVTRNDLHIMQQDITKPLPSIYTFDYIIHGASFASPSAFSKYPVEVMTANFVGMLNVLEYAKEHQVKRILYISSSEVYGKKNDRSLYSEDEYYGIDLLNSRSCYPNSKRAAETLSVAYYKEYGVESVIVRPGHIYGPTSNQNDNRAATQFLIDGAMGKDIVLKSAGMQLRSYCYVVDCVTALLTCLLHGKSGEAYNISNPNSVVTIRELAECISVVTGTNIIFTEAKDEEKVSYNLMDNSALNSDKLIAIGWHSLYDLSKGITATINAMKNNQ